MSYTQKVNTIENVGLESVAYTIAGAFMDECSIILLPPSQNISCLGVQILSLQERRSLLPV